LIKKLQPFNIIITFVSIDQQKGDKKQKVDQIWFALPQFNIGL